MTTYLSGRLDRLAPTPWARLSDAQFAIEQHGLSLATCACRACGAAFPCADYEKAMDVFRDALSLPRRRPGASHPELLGARRVGDRGSLRPHQ
jgi:hypothetical protein